MIAILAPCLGLFVCLVFFFFIPLARARENCVRPSVNILARQRSEARGRVQNVQNNLHIAET